MNADVARELRREVVELRQLVGTWEMAALAAISQGLDAETRERVGDRIRAIVGGVAE